MGGGERYISKTREDICLVSGMFGMPLMSYLAKINSVYQQNLENIKKITSFLSQGHNRSINTIINLKSTVPN